MREPKLFSRRRDGSERDTSSQAEVPAQSIRAGHASVGEIFVRFANGLGDLLNAVASSSPIPL